MREIREREKREAGFKKREPKILKVRDAEKEKKIKLEEELKEGMFDEKN